MEGDMCNCSDENEYVCYAENNDLGMTDSEDVELCGGPCRCSCHHEIEDDLISRLESDYDIDPDMGDH